MELVVESNRSTVVLAIVLVLVGVVVGFGIGFGVGNGTKSDVKVAAASSGTGANQKTNKTQSAAATQRLNQLVRCMANHGVTWPNTGGAPKVATPPPGVDHATYNKALVACYQAAKKGATTVPSTSSN
ncbi:MAG TPA: hypothetical protein VIK54_00270 [Acidimicrobiia bacterium]